MWVEKVVFDFFNVEFILVWNAMEFMLIFFGFTLVFTGLHIYFLPVKEILKKKSTDRKMSVYTLIGIITSLVAALGFGQPYSPTVITIIRFFANFLHRFCCRVLWTGLRNLFYCCGVCFIYSVFWKMAKSFFL